jgi:hypothetical protein
VIANAERSKTASKHTAIAAIADADQITRRLLPPARLRDLIANPFAGCMRRHAKPRDLSPAVPHDQEPVEQPERNGRHYVQVHRGNAVCMIAKKGLPTMRRSKTMALIGQAK